MWLKDHNPLTVPESKFLDDDDDLISLNDPQKPEGVADTEPSSDFVPLCIFTMTVLPLLCFKFMSGVLNRLILLTIVLAAGLSSLEKLDKSKVAQHQQWVAACFGVSLLAAILF